MKALTGRDRTALTASPSACPSTVTMRISCLQEGKVYKCFCSPERLEALRKEQLSKGKMPRYDGRCRSLSQEEVSTMESAGQQPVLRFRVEGGPILFEDLVHGRMSFAPEGIGDFIIVRSDGMAAYNFACVIDDHFMQITHVIRGEDHLSNTPRQIMIYQALGWEPLPSPTIL